MVIDATHFKGVVTEITPENSCHSKIMGHRKRSAHFGDLSIAFGGAKVDRGTDSCSSLFTLLLERSKHDLIIFIWVGEQFVVFELKKKRNFMCITSGYTP